MPVLDSYYSTNCIFCIVPCVWEWEDYGDCSATCGGGTQSRYPVITTPAQHGGDCPPNVVNGVPETRSCNMQTCPREPQTKFYHNSYLTLLSLQILAACPNPDDNNCLINGVYQCIDDPDRDCVVDVRNQKLLLQF